MQPTTDTDYKKLFTQLVQKQILVLGPDITIAKAKNVPGLTIDEAGNVVNITGDPQQLLQALINQYVELSGMIVKKTMESILTSYPGMMGFGADQMMNSPLAASSPVSTQPVLPTSKNDTAITVDGLIDHNEANGDTDKKAPTDSDTYGSEPPSITAVVAPKDGDGLVPAAPQVIPEPTSSEMKDLNKALEELATAPLTEESKVKE